MLIRQLGALAFLFCVGAGAASAQTVDAASAAYQRGDYAAALQMFQALANQGKGDAQYNLGIMYANGRGVPQDYVAAHMWLNLSASHGDQEAAAVRDSLAKTMSPAQVAEAQKMARDWKPKSHQPPARTRKPTPSPPPAAPQ
jgi:TPR repeat protein